MIELGKVFIRGAEGLVGGRMAERWRSRARELVAVDSSAAPDGLAGFALVVNAPELPYPPGREAAKRSLRGTIELIEAAKGAGVGHFIQVSAIGARKKARCALHRRLFEAEEALRTCGLPYTILRPSLVFGDGAPATARIIAMLRTHIPIFPMVGSGWRVSQPIHVDDLVSCAEAVVEKGPELAIREIGGPETMSQGELIDRVMAACGKRRVKLHFPVALCRLAAPALAVLGARAPFTWDSLALLAEDDATPENAAPKLLAGRPIRFSEWAPKAFGRTADR